MKLIADGVYTIDDRLDIPGEGTADFVFARGWLLEVIDVEEGDYHFIANGRDVIPTGRRFGVFYPPFTITRTFVRNVKGRVRGIGSVEKPHGLPDSALMFETDFEGEFTCIDQVDELLTNPRCVRSIEVNSNASLLSIKAKRLIDDNYLVFPSIARIAARLKVSAPHLSRQFKRDFQMTPSAYLHHLRVADATFRLSLGEPIVDISQEVGYNDLSRFYKQFRKQTRTSPAACRETLVR